MKKNLKNSGVTIPVIVIALFIVAIVVYSLFDSSTSFGRAPIGNKVLGVLAMLGSVLFAFKSSDILDFVKKDRTKMWLQIGITAALIILGLLILGVFHSGVLGTTTNPL